MVVSVQPVPDSTSGHVTGLGMRAWGVAQGLRLHGAEVTVLVLDDEPRDDVNRDGVIVRTSRHHPDWTLLLDKVDVVVVLFCVDAGHEIALDARPDLVVVLDAYVPWHLETLARRAGDVTAEYGRFWSERQRHNETLLRGDLFLCASREQRHYYTGILSALGVINPFSYDDPRVLEVPFGTAPSTGPPPPMGSDPYRTLGIAPGDFVLLWFGGVYPWFDFTPVAAAVQTLLARDDRLHFVLVGGQNPWALEQPFDAAWARARDLLAGLDDSRVHLVDWVEHEARHAWYAGATATVSLNAPGLESILSWRTRLADFVAAGLPVITNGGDAFGDLLLAEGAALRTATDGGDLADVVIELHDRPALLMNARAALAALSERFSWGETTRCLAQRLSTGDSPYAREEQFVNAHHLPRLLHRPGPVERQLLQAAHTLRRLREEGVTGVMAIAQDRARAWARTRAGRPDRYTNAME